MTSSSEPSSNNSNGKHHHHHHHHHNPAAVVNDDPYTVRVPAWFLAMSLLTATAMAWIAGRYTTTTTVTQPQQSNTYTRLPRLPLLHTPTTGSYYTYTGSQQLVVTATTDSVVASAAASTTTTTTTTNTTTTTQPAAQHLLVDLSGVDASFLNNPEQLAIAMQQLATIASTKQQKNHRQVLSYHCHALQPTGVSCVALVTHCSHVSLHTWPEQGVITLDWFVANHDDEDDDENEWLGQWVSTVERLFSGDTAAATTTTTVQKTTQWAYKSRGFGPEEKNVATVGDIQQFLWGWMDFETKELIAQVETDFQTIQFYHVLNGRFGRTLESYQRSLTDPTSYEGRNPHLFRPDMIVYLDGVMQSRLYGVHAYHEALVHPVMLSHDNPVRVAIIGGGEGATLRQVLLHYSVQQVVMLEIDDGMMQASRKYLPEWNGCRGGGGEASNNNDDDDCAFDDERATVIATDAIAWLVDHFVTQTAHDTVEPFDVIIMDALDPSASVAFSDVLYDNDSFAQALSAALTEDGILVAQVGEEGNSDNPPEEFDAERQHERRFREHLRNQKFATIKEYNEVHGGFLGVWRFLMAFKSQYMLQNFYRNQAQIDIDLHDRIERPDDGEFPLKYFDGATMAGYQHPNRISQEIFCSSQTDPPPYCERGQGLDPAIPNYHSSNLQVRTSSIPNAGRGVFFTRDGQAGEYVAADQLVHSILVHPSTNYIVERMPVVYGDSAFFKTLNAYRTGYGYSHTYYGGVGYSVEPSLLTFINHGCNDTYVQGRRLSVNEATSDLDTLPSEWLIPELQTEGLFYHPYIDRNHLLYLHAHERLLRPVDRDEELLDNYLNYYHAENWAESVADLRAQCLQQGVGAIHRYQQHKNKNNQ